MLKQRSLKYTQKAHGCECKLTFFASQKFALTNSRFHSFGRAGGARKFTGPLFPNFGQTNNSFILGRTFFPSRCSSDFSTTFDMTFSFSLLDIVVVTVLVQIWIHKHFPTPLRLLLFVEEKLHADIDFFPLPFSPHAKQSLCLFLFTFLAFSSFTASDGRSSVAQGTKFKSIKNSDEMICLLWENVPFFFVLYENLARKAHCAATSDRMGPITRSISCIVVEDAKACVSLWVLSTSNKKQMLLITQKPS